MSDYLQQLILDYESKILGNVYTFVLSNGDTLTFEIKKRNVPHLLGIGRLPLRQVKGKYAGQIYTMLRNGKITLKHVTSVPDHKEVFKKIMNFHHLTSMLNQGSMVKLVKRRGTLKSSYLLYIDHQPDDIVHLGLAKDEADNWYPESLLVLKHNVTAYIDGQMPVDILQVHVSHKESI